MTKFGISFKITTIILIEYVLAICLHKPKRDLLSKTRIFTTLI